MRDLLPLLIERSRILEGAQRGSIAVTSHSGATRRFGLPTTRPRSIVVVNLGSEVCEALE